MDRLVWVQAKLIWIHISAGCCVMRWMPDIGSFKQKKLSMRNKNPKFNLWCHVLYQDDLPSAEQVPQPHAPLMAEQWQAEDWWSIINQWVGVDVIDTAWREKVALPRHLLLWSVASDIITYPAGAPMSPLGRELSKLPTTHSPFTRAHTQHIYNPPHRHKHTHTYCHPLSSCPPLHN